MPKIRVKRRRLSASPLHWIPLSRACVCLKKQQIETNIYLEALSRTFFYFVSHKKKLIIRVYASAAWSIKNISYTLLYSLKFGIHYCD